mmetsp:Transcript_1960/g.1422  ORF Transcript_1960/g.1422 Transcript_1960/m.1422 type:complete len:123 (+) Transcript_1960:1449-1817(+)
MVLEITGQTTHLVPVFLGTLLAYAITSKYSMSLFDVILEFKNLPYLASLGSVEAYFMKAESLMNKNFFYLTISSALSELPVIIHKVKTSTVAIPVVESEQRKAFLFNVQSSSLMRYLEHYFD